MDVDIPTQLTDGRPITCFVSQDRGAQFIGISNTGSSPRYYQIFNYLEGQFYPEKNVNSTSSLYYDVNACIHQGDIIYKREYKEFIFPLVSIIVSCVIFYLAYRLILHKWWRRIR